ncbi:multidrug ABC transporter ATP-binding protein [Zhengella mangrovi]|uniref:Multidrug ABC transporter ATP-binding protein n=1 Tax=Zhengella mangrovi TaxID=1982044 RepID=A0A2G1QP94_9HYPH|nr:ABC transporter ATP-binding protein [Zhengella mangrovi]PHP67356.1 multidrug ABC transporter ATP-binding protein [Zhengella mangrovi]
MLGRVFTWFEGRIDPFPEMAPGQPPDRLWPFVWHFSRPIWAWLALIAFTSALVAVFEVWLFAFLGNVVDWLAAADRDTFLQTETWRLVWMGAVILLILPALTFFDSLILHQSVIGNFPMIIRWLGHRYLLRQSMSFFQDEFAGRVATKLLQASLGVRDTLMKAVNVFVYVIVYVLGTLALIASFNVALMVPFVLWLVGYGLTLRHFLPLMRDISEAQADARSAMTGRIVDSYTNIMTVKLFSHARAEEAYARQSMRDFLVTVHPQMRLVTKLEVMLVLLNNGLLFAVGAVGIGLWLGSGVTAGAVAIALGLVLRLNGMSHWIMWELSGLFENIGMAIDGMQTLARPHAVTDRPGAGALAVRDGRVRFEDVTFHYGKGGGVIEGLNLEVRPGEKIGVVGRSGAGKSTLVNLLLRFHDVEGGQIRIDGQDIAGVTQESLRAAIGMVTQDTSLLHRSVRDNILYGRPDASEKAMEEAARRAEAHDFIRDLADAGGRTGYDAHVGERGVKLSGGQRQRIAIARVMLKDAPILILDEATSALDSEAEAAIQDNLYRLMEGKTVIAIAHRLSTIAAMDRLVVMDQGAIVETGTHDELVNAGGLYAQLWARQSGGFLIEDEAEAAE